jgi:transcriptional regulator with XRE-family HTH domain
VTVAVGGTQTPVIAGADPFERFPHAGGTSATSTSTSAFRGLDREAEPLQGLAGTLAAVTWALTPTASSQPSLATAMRSLIERFQVTRANIQDVLPLLGFGSLPQQATDPWTTKAVPRGNAARALAAVADLHTWLGMTEEQMADIAGFSRRNYSNWRAGQGSYPKTVRGLFEIHALVSGIVRALGTDGAISWLALPSPSGNPRRQLLATSVGRSQLLAEAQPLLFARVEQERPAAEFDEETLHVTDAAQRHAAESLIKTAPQRRRRPG